MSWLNRSSRGASLLVTAGHLLELQRHLSAALPAPLNTSCQIIKWQDDAVTLSVPTPAHSAKIRQVVPRLVATLKQHGWQINQIRVRVMAAPVLPRPPAPLAPDQRPVIDSRGVAAFAELQHHVQPGPLADALTRLIQRRAS